MPYIPEYEEGEKYPGKITGAEFGQAGDKPVFDIAVKGEHGIVFKRLFLTPGAWEFTERVLRDIGLTDEQLDAANIDNLGDFIEGNDVSFLVDHEEYEGKTHTKIKFLNGPSMMRPKKPAANTKAAAIAAFKALRIGKTPPPMGLVSAPRGPHSASGAPPQVPIDQEIDDDSVPF